MKKLLTPAILAAGLFWGQAAAAYPNFPYVTSEHLGMTCMPQCTLCHTSNPGNGGNAKQEFAKSLSFKEADAAAGGAGGASPEEPGRAPRTAEELIVALDAIAAADAAAEPDLKQDSDFDRISDLDELSADPPTDPNGLATEICQPPTRYGCGAARLAPAPRSDSVDWLLVVLPLLGAALLIGRRRSRGAEGAP